MSRHEVIAQRAATSATDRCLAGCGEHLERALGELGDDRTADVALVREKLAAAQRTLVRVRSERERRRAHQLLGGAR